MLQQPQPHLRSLLQPTVFIPNQIAANVVDSAKICRANLKQAPEKVEKNDSLLNLNLLQHFREAPLCMYDRHGMYEADSLQPSAPTNTKPHRCGSRIGYAAIFSVPPYQSTSSILRRKLASLSSSSLRIRDVTSVSPTARRFSNDFTVDSNSLTWIAVVWSRDVRVLVGGVMFLPVTRRCVSMIDIACFSVLCGERDTSMSEVRHKLEGGDASCLMPEPHIVRSKPKKEGRQEVSNIGKRKAYCQMDTLPHELSIQQRDPGCTCVRCTHMSAFRHPLLCVETRVPRYIPIKPLLTNATTMFSDPR